VPTSNPAIDGITLTADFLTRTPGAPDTATALMGSATGIFTPGDTTATPGPQTPLPTFTDPPPLIEATLPALGSGITTETGVPPIVPIIGLALLGLGGLLISSLRRG
jgi:hypothetical protein